MAGRPKKAAPRNTTATRTYHPRKSDLERGPKPEDPVSVTLPLTTREMFVDHDLKNRRATVPTSGLPRDAAPPPPGYRYTLDGRLLPLAEIYMDISKPETQKIFCEIVQKTGSWRAACDAIGVENPNEVKKYVFQDPDFAMRLENACDRHRQRLYDAAYSRATEGWEVPIVGGKNKDEIVAYERRYSDSLLLAMLKRHFPEFRESARALPPPSSTPEALNPAAPDMRSLPRAERDRIRNALKAAPTSIDPSGVIDVDQDEEVS